MTERGEFKIRNAKITSTFLGFEDHGIFTYILYLDYGGSGQGAGLIALGGEFTDNHIRGILKTLEVESWEDLPGRHIRAEASSGCVRRIGHVLKDKWFTIVSDK